MKLRGNNSGFGVLEVMVSSAILMVAVQQAIAALSVNSKSFGHQTKLSGAVHVGQSLLESLLLASDGDPQLADGMHTAYFDEQSQAVASNIFYTAQWTVAHDNPFPAIQRIRVEISWNESGQTRKVDFITYRN